MVKRRAEEPLEETPDAESPASKKSKTENLPLSAPQLSNGALHVNGRNQEAHGNSHDHSLNTTDSEDGKDGKFEEAAEGLSASEEEDKVSAYPTTKRQDAPVEGYNDLYLDTINRSVLDFDFEKLCSVTLSNINVYACLVCGKYFQGRGHKSHAYFHALDIGHHVYVNMETKKVYVLPEGYEVKSKSLDDIKFVVDPRLSKDEVLVLDREVKESRDLDGKTYRPGMSNALETEENQADGCRFRRHE